MIISNKNIKNNQLCIITVLTLSSNSFLIQNNAYHTLHTQHTPHSRTYTVSNLLLVFIIIELLYISISRRQDVCTKPYSRYLYNHHILTFIVSSLDIQAMLFLHKLLYILIYIYILIYFFFLNYHYLSYLELFFLLVLRPINKYFFFSLSFCLFVLFNKRWRAQYGINQIPSALLTQ